MSHVVSCYHWIQVVYPYLCFVQKCIEIYSHAEITTYTYICVLYLKVLSSLHGFKFVLKILQICQHASYKFSFTKYVWGYGKWTFALAFCVHFETHIESHIMFMELHCAELLIFLYYICNSDGVDDDHPWYYRYIFPSIL